MQNEQTLIDLGFHQADLTDHWQFTGKHQKFIATIGYNRTFIELFLVSPNIDMRPNSDTKGLHFQSTIKDCCSSGSVERAINKYDVPEEFIQRQVGYVTIKQTCSTS